MSHVENRAVDTLLRVLQPTSGPSSHLTVEVRQSSGVPVVRVSYADATSEFVPVWAAEGFPKDVERALLDADRRRMPKHRSLVITARAMSTGSRLLLDEAGVSWADESGRARIVAAPAFFLIQDSSKHAMRQPSAFRWTSSAGVIAERLLEDVRTSSHVYPGDFPLPGLRSLAEHVDRSPALISRILKQFDGESWTAKVGSQRGISAGRKLTDPTGMLSSWAAWHRGLVPATVKAHALLRDPRDFMVNQIAPLLPRGGWAVTEWLALEEVAPYTTNVPAIACYLDGTFFTDDRSINRLLNEGGMRRVDQGPRVTFLPAEAHVLAQADMSADLPRVSCTRLYGDLLRAGVRGEDAAEHLRQTTIGF